MSLAFVLRVFHCLTEPPEGNERLVGQKGWHSLIHLALHDQQRGFYVIEIEERRVLDILIPNLPRRPFHQALLLLEDRNSESGTVLFHFSIFGQEIGRAIYVDSGFESISLNNQSNCTVSPVTVSHHSKSARVRYPHVNNLVYAWQDILGEIPHRGLRMLRCVREEYCVSTSGQELQIKSPV